MKSEAQRKELYLLSARGSSNFIKRSIGMELVAELHEQRSVNHTFLEKSVARLALLYCNINNLPATVAESYEQALQEISAMPNREMILAYLTDEDNGELTSMAQRAESQGIRVEMRKRTRH